MLRYVILGFSLLLSIPLYAQRHWVASVMGGYSFMNAYSYDQFLDLDSSSSLGVNGYLKPSEQPHAAMWGAFLGHERNCGGFGIWQLGIGYYQNRSSMIEGPILNFGLAENHNSDYQIKLKHQRLMAEVKWLLPGNKQFYPYVWGGVGAAWNKAYAYQQLLLIPSEATASPFNDNTETNVALGIGVGVDMILTKHFRMGVGYQYIDAGDISVSPTDTQNTQEVITFDSFSGSVFLIQFNALFD